MRYKDIVGQEDVKSQFRRYIQTGKLPHAIMFTGPMGRGSIGLALATATYILCDNRDDFDSCGICPHCKKIDKLIHPDLHFSFPVVGLKNASKKRKDTFSDDYLKLFRKCILESPYLNYRDWVIKMDAENKQGDINAKECFEIIRKLSLKSFSGKSKVLMMWMPELLGNNGNRLLKIIEEPPEDCFLIFVAESTVPILNTILSRVQMILVPPIEHLVLSEYLRNNYQLTNDHAEQISFQSEGNLSEAILQLGSAVENSAKRVLDWLRSCYQANPEALSEWIDNFDRNTKEQQKYFLDYAIHVMRQFIRMEYLSVSDLAINKEEIQTLQKLASFLSFKQCEKTADLLDNAIYGIERNLHLKIMMMSLSIELGTILRKKQAVMA